MLKYKVAVSDSLTGLEEEVLEYLRDGYKLQGGIAIVEGERYTHYCQALLKDQVR